MVITPVVNDTNVTNDGNKLPKGVSVSKRFQVGKEFTYQPKTSNDCSIGNTGTRGVTNPKFGSSKNTNDDASLITKGGNGLLMGVYVLRALGSSLDGMMTLMMS
nr:hypothetical protein [Tanacetum cinerariifolium]